MLRQCGIFVSHFSLDGKYAYLSSSRFLVMFVLLDLYFCVYVL